YRSLFENMNAGFVLFEVVQNEQGIPVDLIVIAANEGFGKTTGLKLKDSVGMYLTHVLPGIEKDEADWIGTYSKVALSGESIQFEQGSELLGVYYSISAFQAGPKQCAVTFVDITERKNAELDLIRMSRIMKNSQEIAHLGSFEYVAATQTTIWSEEEYRIYGLDTDGPSPEYSVMLEKCIHPDDAKLLHDTFMEAMQNQKVYELEHRIVRPDGSVRWVYDKAHPYFDENGNLLRYVGATLDTTERKRLQEELEMLNAELELKVKQRTAQLESANKELESFSYSISHDLRAPLRAIYGFSQILAGRHRASLDEEGKQYMDYIVESSIRMEQLINDLLNYSRLGRKTVEIRPVSLKKIIDAIYDDFKPQVDEIGGKLKVHDNPPVISADESLLRQIFSNLVGNAIKYRRPESVLSISISFETVPDGVLIKVSDNGIGIPAEHCEKIFNVFQRLHGEDKYPGTGIGLANVKKAVSMLGGTIYVESTVGQGSTFIMEFPNKNPESHE
ncbi:MAG: PAS domain-containing protein, partial [Bacteroidales bacterium]|nr:PAS domain-containing protein [Bacteroidales bacterium]